MAIDPSTPVGAAPVAPVEPVKTLREVGPTPGSIAQQREYAKALLKQKYQPPNAKYPFYTWANGLDDASAKIMGGMALHDADVAEKRYYAGAADSDRMPGSSTGYTPPAGSTPTSSAPGGATSSSPFQASLMDGKGSGEDRKPSSQSSAAFDLSSRGETSKTGHAALFNISPDTGGSKSYGPLGLNSKSGSVSSFVKDHPEFELTAPPGTKEFDEQWRKTAATRKDEFGKAHEDWHQKNIMGGLTDSMTRAGVDPRIASDPRVKAYMADRKVQMGSAGMRSALDFAKNAPTPESFIHTVSQIDKANVSNNFRSYLRDHPNDVRGLSNRIDLRHNTALAMADPGTTADMVDYHKNRDKTASLAPVLGDTVPSNAPQSAVDAWAAANPAKFSGAATVGPGGVITDTVPPVYGPGTSAATAAAQGGTREASIRNNAQIPASALSGDLPSSTPSSPTSPTRLAQNTAPGSLPEGTLQTQLQQTYRNLIYSGMPPDEAAKQAEHLLRMRIGTKGMETGVMPQYRVDDYGQVFQEAPGQLPKLLPGTLPGHFGSFKEEPDMGGAGIRSTVETDPKTGQRYIKRQYEVPNPPLPPRAPPAPSSGATPTTPPAGAPPRSGPAAPLQPGLSPSGATVQAPPVGPQGAPGGTPAVAEGGFLTNNPPMPKGQIASISPDKDVFAEAANQLIGKPSEFDKVAQPLTPDLYNPVTPTEQKAKEALEWAEKPENRPTPWEMPDVLTPALESGNIGKLSNIKSNRKIQENATEDAIKEEGKVYNKLQIAHRTAKEQGVKLAPGLKTAIKSLDSPEMVFGPLSGTEVWVRGFREEAENLLNRWASDVEKNNEDPSVKHKGDPSIYKKMAGWVKNADNSSATANQIYNKILQGTILQSLRGMLGENAGQFRVQELKMLEQAFGNQNLTKDANKAVMHMIDKINDRNIVIGQMATQYAKKHHGLDPAFEEAVDRFETRSPPYTPEEFYNTLKLVIAPGPAPATAPSPAPGAGPPPPGAKTTPGGLIIYPKGYQKGP